MYVPGESAGWVSCDGTHAEEMRPRNTCHQRVRWEIDCEDEFLGSGRQGMRYDRAHNEVRLLRHKEQTKQASAFAATRTR